MKIFHIFLAVGLFTATVASAQTTPGTAVPSVPGASGTASPSTTPSGMAAPTPNANGSVSSEEVFTKGAPVDKATGDKRMKRKKTKDAMPESGKMKTKM
ncbi:MAG: hypothetical protein EOO61_06275 [Hymenobacter sp.]|nr:MAG: hypothetical protein EOO61_06275 [Hymenobacter sp.]